MHSQKNKSILPATKSMHEQFRINPKPKPKFESKFRKFQKSAHNNICGGLPKVFIAVVYSLIKKVKIFSIICFSEQYHCSLMRYIRQSTIYFSVRRKLFYILLINPK